MAQINSTVGDIEQNLKKIKKYIIEANKNKSDIIIFPELATTGYPPQDLLLDTTFVKKNKELLEQLILNNAEDIVGVIGFVNYKGNKLYNAAAVFNKNKIVKIIHKTLLPSYDIFNEDRYFNPAKQEEIKPIKIKIHNKQFKLGVQICEDLWDEDYNIKITDLLVKRGANIILNISSSPYYSGKCIERQKLLKEKSRKNKTPIFYVNLVGGQDEIVFDGQSLAVDNSGELIGIGKQFKEDLILTDINLENGLAKKTTNPSHHIIKEMFNATVLGTQDYFKKNNFKSAVIGLSGGIDSSLTACIATEALGNENIIGVSMPSKYSSNHSKTDAETLADNLGICFVKIPIQNMMSSYQQTLEQPLEKIRKKYGLNQEKDNSVADENIQPRIRGNCLMDISNRLKDLKILVLATGNKTEIALGYCTLYGDMVGAIGPIGDVSKLEVYKLAKYVNKKAGENIIPTNVFTKKPSAELKVDQFDPFDFDIISPLVDEIIENKRSKNKLIEMGYSKEIIEDTANRIKNMEYKRRQAAPSIKITSKAFGIGRKMPIVNKYTE